ncbi:MAG: class I SAM-dependent methyltransferase [Candidatus Peribacteraceae bacterium]|jgi:SAM-dependent methyltransferase
MADIRDDAYCKKYFGARKDTIERLKNLYGAAYFEERKDESGRKRDAMQDQEMGRLRQFVDMTRGGNALDMGCGTGGFLERLGPTWKKYGIEVSDVAREAAERRDVVTDFELKDGFFDLIIFRGTIQHIPDPIARIGECFYWLKPGGVIAFLATPNTNSLCYRLFGSLPMIRSDLNFLLPSDVMLRQILENFGFEMLGFAYPYRGTPYARPALDLASFLLKLLGIGGKGVHFAFYRNSLECFARKP